MVHPATLPGFFATTETDGPLDAGVDAVADLAIDGVRMWCWGETVSKDELSWSLSRVNRDETGVVAARCIAHRLASDPHALSRMQPPFAAVGAGTDHLTMVADSMGFQPLFHSDPDGELPAFMSSSSLVAAGRVDAALDQTAVAVQSLLGWQLGQRTLFAGVQKLAPGAVARLGVHGLDTEAPREVTGAPISLRDAVTDAAALLRESLTQLLDDHPDAVLQLTGGMDSRLLLSAIPPNRRRGLRAMTLDVPGGGDVTIARSLADRYGLEHEVHGLVSIEGIEPKHAWQRCVEEAIRLDAMADPVALAAQRTAEREFDQGVRISGLGGEVARGFYYVGRIRDRDYNRQDVERLASWRMFVNDAVQTDLLTREFASWARQQAHEQVYAAMRQGGDEWFRAADHLYLRHRMQRWAGATDTAVSDQRTVINPMLDPGFLQIAVSLTPADKAGSRFLGALQMALDPELGRIPLDGRPAPAAYADPPLWQPALDAYSLGRRAFRKGVQRIRRGNRPPAGGDVMAAKVVQWWRENPGLLEPLDSLGFLRQPWLSQVVDGAVEPRPSSVAFLTNLILAVARPEGR